MRTLVFALLSVFCAWPQTPAKTPVFEAAAIKPADPNALGSSSWNTDAGRITARNETLKRYIMIAYDLKPYQVTGGPPWMDKDGYDITAKLEDMGEEGLPPKEQRRLRAQAEDARIRTAMQSLLAERFQLKFHRETKMMPAYALVVAKGGLKIEPVPNESGSGMNSTGSATGIKLTATRANMDRIATFLANQLRQPVANKTGVEGVFNFTLEWMPDDMRNSTSTDPRLLPSIFTALQERLGLKLEGAKEPAEIMVVDSAERPSGN